MGFGQSFTKLPTTAKKGEFYAHWGWNREWYNKSDIEFSGDNYAFTLKDVVAKDKPAEFDINTYFSPKNVTIPQYNFRIGYYFNDHYHLSLGVDHMKYVVQKGQTVKIDGEINETNNPYNGTYTNDDILIEPGFLEMEHTDGLNYSNVEIGRFDHLLQYKKVTLSVTEAVGVGVMYPKTDAHLFGYERHDEFHVAGFGMNTQIGLNFKFYNHFYIQSEFRGGYVNMPNIRTTYDKADNAKQQFFYSQFNVLFGAFWHLNKD
ncbi:MAG: hypothetical protein COA58_12035 [Bacteroidetes bacterium]|nr:MAG: hypothetical protein COA58_12035 [Bacteroidota bacterium]